MKKFTKKRIALNRYLVAVLISTLILSLIPRYENTVIAESPAAIVTFQPIVEDIGAYDGQPVSDIAPGKSYIGIKSVDDLNGQWQWFNGTQWLNISDRLSENSILFLSEDPV